MSLSIYVISLPNSADRLNRLSSQLKQQSLEFNLIQAFDARAMDPETLDDYNNSKCLRFLGRSLSGGEYGCYKSHILAAQAIAKGNEEFGIVLEDDIDICIDFQNVVHKTVQQLSHYNKSWSVVHLGAERLKYKSFLGAIDDRYNLFQAHYFPMTTSGLLWKRSECIEFIKNFSEISMPIDFLLREVLVRSAKGYALVPPIVQQTGVSSTIDTPERRRKQQMRQWNYGLKKQRRLLSNKAIAIWNKARYEYLSQLQMPRACAHQ